MNTSALKTFAPAVRKQLMEAVTRKLDFALSAKTPDYLTTFAPQVAALRKIAQADRAGLIDRVAYTWFNRLAALRFMDARGWHPFRARVLTPATLHETQPELLKITRAGAIPEDLKAHTDPARLNDLLDSRIPSPDAQGEVYRHLVLAACRFYHALLPNLFEKLDDETELLLPDDLLTEQSVVHGFRTEINDEDCGDGQRANVEILGWLYQFYISERKDQVMARKSAVPTEDIPAVTQLFTPHWIVRYLVENSLGRLWLLNRPGSRLREHMPYYIEESTAEPPAWQADWKRFFSSQDGEWKSSLWLRPNQDLKDDPDAVISYALTVDGYAYARDVWRIPNASSGGASDKLDSMIIEGQFIGSFEDLRGALFLWQRATKWGESAESYRNLKLCYEAVCRAWEKEWQENTSKLPNLAAHGIRLPEAPSADLLKITKPEEIRLCDPAVGSGHMLTYSFDLLTLIYEEDGYAPTEIPGLILQHNLHGLEICPRAAQLAELALVFKAREKSRRFFQPEHLVRPRIIELKDIKFADGELAEYFKAIGINPSSFIPNTSSFPKLLHQFEEAKNLGSLIQPCLDEKAIANIRSAIEVKDLGGQLFLRETHLKVLRVLEQAEALTKRYHVVVANPPYMGSKGMNPTLLKHVEKSFPSGKADLMTAFMLRGLSMLCGDGMIGCVTLDSWMFLSTFLSLRTTLLSAHSIQSLVHVGWNCFPDGHTYNRGVAFVIRNSTLVASKGLYINLSDVPAAVDKRVLFEQRRINGEASYRIAQGSLSDIPGKPIAYWISERILQTFRSSRTLADVLDAREGMSTGSNATHVRLWWEPSIGRIGFGCTSRENAKRTLKKWFPYNKGGPMRRWYGNSEQVVNWENDGLGLQTGLDPTGTRIWAHNFNLSYIFRPSVSWGDITTRGLSGRFFGPGYLFDATGLSAFSENPNHIFIGLALLNSIVGHTFAEVLNPTLHFKSGDFAEIPLPPEIPEKTPVIVQDAVAEARADWDSFETSWDFREQPLLGLELKAESLEASWRNWEAKGNAAIRRMQELETENNRLLIAAYRLEGELQPEVSEEQITLARAEARRDMAAFISYAVGCMMGRYSPDHPGLILANAGDSLREFLEKVGKPLAELTFAPDEDGIIPVLDGEWFEDDIVARTRDFLRVIFGEATLRDNLRFLEDSLGKDLRKYFLNDFYKDHLQTYKKRPIYWLVQSPKKGFSALIYLHRYTKDTMNLVLNRYLRDYQTKLRIRLPHLLQEQATASTAKAKTEARKEAEKLTKILHECEEWERQTILPLAQARIELDLDDGVKVNYLKLGEALAPIPGFAAKDDE